MVVFLKLLHRWESAELNQEEAAELLGVSERTFRRWTRRYEEEGLVLLIGGSASRRASGFQSTGRKRWRRSIASATRASPSNISMSIW
jgi:transposase